MKLDHLYSLRRNFTIIGLTGRTGSGCTTIARLLSKKYNYIEKQGLRDFEEYQEDDNIFLRKYNIVKYFMSTEGNWSPYTVISYKNVLLFYIYNKYGGKKKKLKELLDNYYKDSSINNEPQVNSILNEITKIYEEYKTLINSIYQINNIENVKDKDELEKLEKIFFGKEFKSFSKKIFEVLQSKGYLSRTNLLHHVACNIRRSGNPILRDGNTIENIYIIAKVINRLIKAKKLAPRKY